MAKLITKFKYLKPNRKKSVGNYARYIATREGVEKIDDSKKYAPATKKQQELIEKLIKDFPESKDSFEYKDYLAFKNMETATDFISRTMEDYSYEISGRKTYAKYIATRPRAERFGSHGLFTDDGVEIKLNNLVKELDENEGNIWTAVISLRREDAERLGFNNGERWRDFMRSQALDMAHNMKISPQNFRWYAAFHNESHHPHIHLIAFSENQKEGYLSEQGLNKIRSSLGKGIFEQDFISVYKKQTEQRDLIRDEARELVSNAVASINSGYYDNHNVQELLLKLADRLSKTKGKKVYGYLAPETKDLVDSILRELADDDRIKALYELWCEQKEEILRTYTDDMPKRIPIEKNKEFKKIKNIIIKEALNLAVENDDISDENNTVIEDDSHIKTSSRTTSQKAKSTSILELRLSNSAFAYIRLLRYLSDLIRKQLDIDEDNQIKVESKLKRKIEDKKQGLGLH